VAPIEAKMTALCFARREPFLELWWRFLNSEQYSCCIEITQQPFRRLRPRVHLRNQLNHDLIIRAGCQLCSPLCLIESTASLTLVRQAGADYDHLVGQSGCVQGSTVIVLLPPHIVVGDSVRSDADATIETSTAFSPPELRDTTLSPRPSATM